MSIVVVRERRGYDHSYSFGKYAPNREFTRHFWVYSDTVAEDPLVIRAASGVPQPADVHPTDTGCIVQRVNLRRDEDVPKRWEVAVTYSNATRDTEKDTPATIEDYIKISVTTRQGQRLVESTIGGGLLRNSAGDLIEGLTVPWNAMQISIVQFVTSEPAYYTVSQWVNAINSAPWRSVPAYFARINALSYEPDKYEGTSCFRRTAVVDLAHTASQPWGWRERVLNAGIHELVDWDDGAGLQPMHIRDDKTSTFISKPVPLNNDGGRAAPTDDPIYIDLKALPEMDFALLGI